MRFWGVSGAGRGLQPHDWGITADFRVPGLLILIVHGVCQYLDILEYLLTHLA